MFPCSLRYFANVPLFPSIFCQCSLVPQNPWETLIIKCDVVRSRYAFAAGDTLENEVNSRLADTPLLRIGAKSPAETTKKFMDITLGIADFRYYGIVDTSRGSQTNIFIVLLS